MKLEICNLKRMLFPTVAAVLLILAVLACGPVTPPPGPSPKVSRQPPVQRGERALLSLRVDLETAGGRPIRFRREGGAGELILRLRDRSHALTLRWLVVAAVLLAAWVWRRAPRSQRGTASVLGLVVPIGLSGLVPPVFVPALDGLLLGTLAAAGLWMLLWGQVQMQLNSKPSNLRG